MSRVVELDPVTGEPLRQHRCGLCAWWLHVEALFSWGECRRYPPAIAHKDGACGGPVTEYKNWCGEWKARDAE